MGDRWGVWRYLLLIVVGLVGTFVLAWIVAFLANAVIELVATARGRRRPSA